MPPFLAEVPVRFGDVDYARIAYYPRILHLLHVAFEEMFERHVGIPYAKLLGEIRVGFPCAHMECDFRKPFRFGDVLRVSMVVTHIGQSSVHFEDEVRVGDEPEPRAVARIQRVAIDMETLRPIPIPARLRAPLEALYRDPEPQRGPERA